VRNTSVVLQLWVAHIKFCVWNSLEFSHRRYSRTDINSFLTPSKINIMYKLTRSMMKGHNRSRSRRWSTEVCYLVWNFKIVTFSYHFYPARECWFIPPVYQIITNLALWEICDNTDSQQEKWAVLPGTYVMLQIQREDSNIDFDGFRLHDIFINSLLSLISVV